MDINKNFRDQVQELFPLERKVDELSMLRNKVQNMLPLSESEKSAETQEKDSVFTFPTDIPEREYDDDFDKDKIRENVSNAVSDKKLNDMLDHLFS